MKLNATLFAAAILSGSMAAAFAADITGKVTLDGTPPKEIPIQPLMDDRFCGPLHTDGPVMTRNYVVSADKGLANTFVYVKAGLEGKKFDLPAGPEPLLDQVACIYEPYVLGVMVNQKIKVRTSDATLHNVHSLSAKTENSFNFAQMTKGQENEKTFGAAELPVTVKCDVHSWMFAYVGVFEHPFFAVTDKDGAFKITGLPAGKYTLEAFHRKAGKTTQEITVGGDNQKVDFTLKAPIPQ